MPSKPRSGLQLQDTGSLNDLPEVTQFAFGHTKS